jgi:hypothetical protein
MAQETYVALFPSLEQAETARRALEAAGIPADAITVTSRDPAGPLSYAAAATAEATAAAPHGAAGIFDWFFATEPPVAGEGDAPPPIGEDAKAVLSLVAEAEDTPRIRAVLARFDLIPLSGPGGTDA